MPLYEYDCDVCGRFEIIQRFSDPALSACPKCGKPVQKLLSAPAVHFKGTGWYVTDYGRKSSGETRSSASKAGESKTADSSNDASTPTTTTSKNSSATSGSSPSK